jgi:hypothetical protein
MFSGNLRWACFRPKRGARSRDTLSGG